MTQSGQVFTPKNVESGAKAKRKEIMDNVPITTPNTESQEELLSPKVTATQKEAEPDDD